MSEEPQIRLYGNWHPTAQAAGMGRLTLGQTMGLLIGAAVAMILAQTAGLAWAAGELALLGLVLGVAMAKDKHGLNVMDRAKERRMFSKARRRKATVYRGGVLAPSKRSDGSCRLPGVAGGTTLSEHEDAHRRPFVVIHHPDGRLTVPMALAPAGIALVDQDMVDRQVALWGMWLADLAGMTGVTDASVTVETAPDTGVRLRREVTSHASDQAPQVARQIIEAVVDREGGSGASVTVTATVSFQPSQMSTERRGRTKRAIRDIATRLPGLTQSLAATGAGSVHLLTAAEITRMARVAYDPAVEAVLDDMALEGVHMPLDWSQAGPVGAQANWDSYAHDSGLSRSWTMTSPPRAAVQSNVLAPLLSVSNDVERKRVTILYRPLPASRSPEVVERDVDKAANAVRMSKRPTERRLRSLEAARQTSREEADGAALVDFGVIVTATVTGGGDAARRLADAGAAVESRAAAARLLSRPAYGAQDTAFSLALPLGISPARGTLTGGW